MANVNGMIVAELKRRVLAGQKQLARLEGLIREFGGSAGSPATKKGHPGASGRSARSPTICPPGAKKEGAAAKSSQSDRMKAIWKERRAKKVAMSTEELPDTVSVANPGASLAAAVEE